MPPEALSTVHWASKSADGRFDDFPSHLGAALTLVCDRREEVIDELPMRIEGTNRYIFLETGDVADKRLVSPLKIEDPTSAFTNLCVKLASLNQEAEVAITTAINLHYGAVLLFDRDLAAAYTLMIAGIETLSRQFGTPPTYWAAWDRAEHWDKFIRKNGLSAEQGTALREDLMKDRQLRLKETFVNYVLSRLPDAFWSTPWQDYLYAIDGGAGCWKEGDWRPASEMRDFLPEDKAILRNCLRRSYDARSSFVHAGQRIVSVVSQMRELIAPASGDRPLAFAVLRSILTALIFVELDDNSRSYELPEILLKHQ